MSTLAGDRLTPDTQHLLKSKTRKHSFTRRALPGLILPKRQNVLWRNSTNCLHLRPATFCGKDGMMMEHYAKMAEK